MNAGSETGPPKTELDLRGRDAASHRTGKSEAKRQRLEPRPKGRRPGAFFAGLAGPCVGVLGYDAPFVLKQPNFIAHQGPGDDCPL
jgi:hypothetical protein